MSEWGVGILQAGINFVRFQINKKNLRYSQVIQILLNQSNEELDAEIERLRTFRPVKPATKRKKARKKDAIDELTPFDISENIKQQLKDAGLERHCNHAANKKL